MSYNYWTFAFPIVTVLCLLFFFIYYYRASRPLSGTVEWIQMSEKPPLSFAGQRHKMEKRDILPLILVTLIYAAVAFIGLGDTKAPQSFRHFSPTDNTVIIELNEETDISSVMYYTGLWSGSYSLSFSSDGKNWDEQLGVDEDGKDQDSMQQSYAELFKWQYASLNAEEGNEPNELVKYIKITTSSEQLELGELALYDGDGNLISTDKITTDDANAALFDEQNIVPESPTYMNSMYFDEIYHGRTAYENVRGVYPYEVSHPPLGKLIISIGIQIFHMTAFGWRFMGTLFGVLMLPLLYIFLKNLFGKTKIAVCGTLLFAYNFMHFVQTRICTIDTYSVMFIMLMYFFMYRFLTTDYELPKRKSLLPLFLCGLSFGIGIACKWTSVYAGAGLALLYIVHMILRLRYDLKNQQGRRFVPYFIVTVLFSVLSFIIIPAIIYCLSYIPYGLAKGMSIQDGMLWNPEYYKIIWDNQVFMYTYHSTLVATHPYSSKWYEWLLDIRPILYYRTTTMNDTMKSAIAAFDNPLVSWGGLLAILAMAWQTIWRKDGKALFILIGYLSQLGPWILISRCTFAYHYFPSSIFLVLALAHVFNTILERRRGRYNLVVTGYTAASVGLFAAFYPVLSGLTVPVAYTTHFLRWIADRWPL